MENYKISSVRPTQRMKALLLAVSLAALQVPASAENEVVESISTEQINAIIANMNIMDVYRNVDVGLTKLLIDAKTSVLSFFQPGKNPEDIREDIRLPLQLASISRCMDLATVIGKIQYYAEYETEILNEKRKEELRKERERRDEALRSIRSTMTSNSIKEDAVAKMRVDLEWERYLSYTKSDYSYFSDCVKSSFLVGGSAKYVVAMDLGVITITRKGSNRLLSKKEVWRAFYNKEKLEVHYDHNKWPNIDSIQLDHSSFPEAIISIKDKIESTKTAIELGLSFDMRIAMDAGIITVTLKGSDKVLSWDEIAAYCSSPASFTQKVHRIGDLVINWDHEKYPELERISFYSWNIDWNEPAYLTPFTVDYDKMLQNISNRFDEIMNTDSKKDNSSRNREWREQGRAYQKRIEVQYKALKNGR